MNRFAKTFRTISGLFLLADLIVFFLPIFEWHQENYPTEYWSRFDNVKSLFLGELATEELAWTIAFLLLPAVLVLVFGIIGIVGSSRQIVSGIGSVLLFGITVFYFFYNALPFLKEERQYEMEKYKLADLGLFELQDCKVGLGLWLWIGFSAMAAIFGVLGLFATPRRKKKQEKVQEKEQQEIIPQQKQDIQEEHPDVALPPDITEAVQQPMKPERVKGVMVGLSGDYQGAEIPFKDGETIKIGRDASNDLIFVNADRVSRFHCTLTWFAERQKFQIVDKSSNGSFINGLEECIPQNIAIYLEPGTILDIGNEQNRFRLE